MLPPPNDDALRQGIINALFGVILLSENVERIKEIAADGNHSIFKAPPGIISTESKAVFAETRKSQLDALIHLIETLKVSLTAFGEKRPGTIEREDLNNKTINDALSKLGL